MTGTATLAEAYQVIKAHAFNNRCSLTVKKKGSGLEALTQPPLPAPPKVPCTLSYVARAGPDSTIHPWNHQKSTPR